jgi:hypothetical protein
MSNQYFENIDFDVEGGGWDVEPQSWDRAGGGRRFGAG